MANLFTQKFWRDLTERTVSSTAQGFLTGSGLAGGAAAAGKLTLDGFPWAAAFGGAAIMAMLTAGKCLAAIEIGDKGTASLTKSAESTATDR